jgi:hypothetical protein
MEDQRECGSYMKLSLLYLNCANKFTFILSPNCTPNYYLLCVKMIKIFKRTKKDFECVI